MSGFNVLLRMFHSNCCTLWVWQWNIEYIEFDRHGSNFFLRGERVVPPYLLINNLFSAETKFPTVSKILPPILNISQMAKKLILVCMERWMAKSYNKQGFFCLLYFSTFSTFLHYSPLTDRIWVFQSVQSHIWLL